MLELECGTPASLRTRTQIRARNSSSNGAIEASARAAGPWSCIWLLTSGIPMHHSGGTCSLHVQGTQLVPSALVAIVSWRRTRHEASCHWRHDRGFTQLQPVAAHAALQTSRPRRAADLGWLEWRVDWPSVTVATACGCSRYTQPAPLLRPCSPEPWPAGPGLRNFDF